jgi:trk system potassium uptake protein TrkH
MSAIEEQPSTSSPKWLWETPRRSGRGSRLAAFWRMLTPAQLFVGSFLVLILLGTAGFKTLPGLYAGAELSWLDALFTATSAVCVTGLIVVDTAEFFTTWGQAYILVLIQLGGLGIISFTSVIISTLGRKLSLRHEAMAGDAAAHVPHIDYRDLTGAIFRFTIVMEIVGALLLYSCWVPRFGWGFENVWHAVFQSVSAFCNAGFSTFTTSLEAFQGNAPLLAVMMVLIVVGGLGFLTLEEVYVWGRSGQGRLQSGRRFRLSLHSQIVLGATAVLLVVGWGLFTVFEWSNTLAGMPLADRLVNGLFASVTPRTAGFNTIDYAETLPSTNFLTILFMSVGGSPGSTAGGLKTTTAAILVILAWSGLRGQERAHVSNRTIPDQTVHRAMALFVVAFGVVTAGIYGLTLVEFESVFARAATESDFLVHMFEAVSAFNTVGLSMGATPNLSGAGRWLTIVLMFIGRVGPLAVAAALSRNWKKTSHSFRYAHEEVAIG